MILIPLFRKQNYNFGDFFLYFPIALPSWTRTTNKDKPKISIFHQVALLSNAFDLNTISPISTF